MVKFIPLFKIILLIVCSFVHVSHSAQAAEKSQHKETANWKIINYWAEWCTPCRQEIPELNRLAVLLSETNITLVGVNYDDLVGDELAEVVSRMNIHFPQLSAQQQVLFNFPTPAALPATYLVSPAGELKLRLIGKQTLENILSGMDKVNPNFSTDQVTINKS